MTRRLIATAFLAVILSGCDSSGEAGAFGDHSRIYLRLPFNQEWRVVEPPTLPGHGAHDIAWVRVHNGQERLEPGAANTDYFGYGELVRAAGAGTVIAVEDEIPENIPGSAAPGSSLGNYVVIDHHTGETSTTAHLQQGSITVAVGQAVRAGEVLGRCGNSGAGLRPMLRFRLERDGAAMPPEFRQYEADGARVLVGIPQAGQKVKSLWRTVRNTR